jgi:hypothetical protein
MGKKGKKPVEVPLFEADEEKAEKVRVCLVHGACVCICCRRALATPLPPSHPPALLECACVRRTDVCAVCMCVVRTYVRTYVFVCVCVYVCVYTYI